MPMSYMPIKEQLAVLRTARLLNALRSKREGITEYRLKRARELKDRIEKLETQAKEEICMSQIFG